MTLKLHNSIPKDPYTKQLCEEDWLIGHQSSVLVLSKKMLIYFRRKKVIKAIFLYEKLFSLDYGHNPKIQQSLHTIAVQADSEREAAEQVFQSCPDYSFQHFSCPKQHSELQKYD